MLLFGDEVRECAVKANGRILWVDLPLTSPRQVNDCEAVWVVEVTKQNVLIWAECHRLNGAPEKQMIRRQLDLQLRMEALRSGCIVGVNPSPLLWKLQMACWWGNHRDLKKFKHQKIEALKPRTLVLIANARSLERIGVPSRAVEQLAQQMKLN